MLDWRLPDDPYRDADGSKTPADVPIISEEA